MSLSIPFIMIFCRLGGSLDRYEKNSKFSRNLLLAIFDYVAYGLFGGKNVGAKTKSFFCSGLQVDKEISEISFHCVVVCLFHHFIVSPPHLSRKYRNGTFISTRSKNHKVVSVDRYETVVLKSAEE